MDSSLPGDANRLVASKHRWLLAAFTTAIFVSAALLFAVQPMFAKMVLPRLGGAPSVWSVAMVFFQAALLAGYGYAHLLTRYAPGRVSVVVHVAVLLVAAFTLPLAIATGWGRPPAEGEALWLLGLFSVSIGLPFFALSANSSLLQAWFARTDHPAASDPYFLYVASNIGSFLALLSYPALIEPFLPLSEQARLWSLGFSVLIVLIAGCGALVWRSAPPARTAAVAAPPPGWRDALSWLALAAVPAGLLVAVTAHLSTDVAAVPLLWVLPLALYLATFIIVFQRRPLIPHKFAVNLQPLFILAIIGVMIFDPVKMLIGQIALHLSVFFVFALVCHGELARRRPRAEYLTSFYMWMSAGGVIGGVAAALIAPRLFNWVAEYPILIVLAVLCRPGPWWPKNWQEQYLLLGALVAATLALIAYRLLEVEVSETTFNWIVGGIAVASLMFWRAPLPLAATVTAVLAFNYLTVEGRRDMSVRSFFGVHKITESADGMFRVLSHGTTMHGAQRIRDPSGRPVTGRPEVAMYYYDGSAIAQVMDTVRAGTGGPIRYAVVGLGAGSLACRATPADTVHYYEIDAAIIRIARDPALFSFLSECRPEVPIIVGDARLTLAEAPDGGYDLIVVDAFTSDAIPIHLLTREAMAVYKRKLSPHGIVVMHISNRHLELVSVVAGIAAANGMAMRLNEGYDVEEDDARYRFIGTVAAIARSDDDFGTLARSQYWEARQPDPRQRVWTDDYSNIVGAVIRHLRQ